MKFFKAFGRFLKAKDAEAAEALEDGREVDFAKQDLEKMEVEHRTAIRNVSQIKARVIGLERNVKGKNDEIKKRTSDAEALLKAGKESLAQQHCAKIEALQAEIEALKSALKQQKDLLDRQEGTRDQLKSAVDTARTEIKIMKTQADVAKSNESLAVVSTSGAQSALSSFKARREKMQAKLDESQALADEEYSSSDKSLEDETADALGNTAGSEMLAKLKAKK